MNWKIGDRATLIRCRCIENEGLECEIVSDVWTDKLGYSRWPIHCATGAWDALAEQLKPIPYDGNNASTWDQCDFKPAVLVEL